MMIYDIHRTKPSKNNIKCKNSIYRMQRHKYTIKLKTETKTTKMYNYDLYKPKFQKLHFMKAFKMFLVILLKIFRSNQLSGLITFLNVFTRKIQLRDTILRKPLRFKSFSFWNSKSPSLLKLLQNSIE